MTVSKGEIWLVNLNPIKKNNEMGKIRPVVVYQNDELNHSDYPTTIVLPLSTYLIDDAEPLRFRIKSRDLLEEDSDIVISQIRAIDNTRFIKRLGQISDFEISKIKELFEEITL